MRITREQAHCSKARLREKDAPPHRGSNPTSPQALSPSVPGTFSGRAQRWSRARGDQICAPNEGGDGRESDSYLCRRDVVVGVSSEASTAGTPRLGAETRASAVGTPRLGADITGVRGDVGMVATTHHCARGRGLLWRRRSINRSRSLKPWEWYSTPAIG